MTFLLKKMILPLIFGGLAVAVFFGLKQTSNFSDTISIVIGCAVFCVLMALWNYGLLAWQSKQMHNKLTAIFGLEDDLLRRINDIEAGRAESEIIENLHKRIETLESAAILKNNSKDQLDQADDLAGFHDENVVMLQSNRAFADRLPKKPAASKRARNQMVTKSLAENPISIRLQPIVNLMTKEICAVEAIAYLNTPKGVLPASELLDAFSNNQLCDFDKDVVTKLTKVARKMEADGQVFPIHFTFNSLNVKDHETWSAIISLIKADKKLASVFVPQLPMPQYTILSEEKLARFMELKEYGLKPAISECAGAEAVFNIAKEKRISNFKIPVTELLNYTAKEGERVADVLLPKLAKLGIEPMATHIDKAHQAANLIDMDVTNGQGDFISVAREIDLENKTGQASANAAHES